MTTGINAWEFFLWFGALAGGVLVLLAVLVVERSMRVDRLGRKLRKEAIDEN